MLKQTQVNIKEVTGAKTRGYFDVYDMESYRNERYDLEPKQSKKVSLPEHKVETNLTELLYYLEEMYHMDQLDDIETAIYERYTYGEKVSKSEWLYVYKNCHKMQFEKF